MSTRKTSWLSENVTTTGPITADTASQRTFDIDNGGLGSINALLILSKLYQAVRLESLLVPGWREGGAPIADIMIDSHTVESGIRELDSDKKKSRKLVVNSQQQPPMPNLPYEESTDSYEFKISGDAYRFQLLFMVRWIQQVLMCRPLPQLNIDASKMQSEKTLQCSWSQDCKDVPTIKPLFGQESKEESMLADSFITRVLGLFTLSREDDIVEYCKSSVDQDQKLEMKGLFSKVSEWITNDEDTNSFVDYFFRKLEGKDSNILELIRFLEEILSEMKNGDYRNPGRVDVDDLIKHFIIMVGVYFAVLPAVKNREAFIEKYGLQQDFKMVEGVREYDTLQTSGETDLQLSQQLHERHRFFDRSSPVGDGNDETQQSGYRSVCPCGIL